MIKPLEWFLLFLGSIAMVAAAGGARAEVNMQDARIKDLVQVRGIRANQLVGVGLVVGLNKSGDSQKSIMTNRVVAGMLNKFGYKVTDQEIAGGSAAAVLVVVEMPTFSRNGDKLDARVSVMGDAKSLAGGVLVSTPLKAGDGQVYGFAQGPVVVSQATGEGARVLTVANIASGAVIEKEFNPMIEVDGKVSLSLKRPDFTTNHRVVEAINKHLRGYYAKSIDITGIDVELPMTFDGRVVEFISEIENLRVAVDQKSVVVINERTGTVVMGGDVLISPVTISHGDLSIAVGGGKSGAAKSEKSVVTMGGTTVNKLVESMNAMGMKPADLIGVMQALQSAGALQADIKFM
jgi:flagellar P-ring protein precursor FlgI